MNLNNITFPYPILGSYDDFVSAPCKMDPDLKTDNSNYYFDIKLSYENEEISKLVEDDFADYVCEVTCAVTRYRRCYKGKDLHFTITVPRRDVGEDIYFTCTITAKKNIPNYSNSQFHSDYKGHSFNLEAGDLLAIFPQFKYTADIKYDKLKAVGTFMEIRMTEEHTPSIWFNKGDKIILDLPKELYEEYEHKPQINKQAEILHSSLVMNALIYALCNIGECKDRKWARTILYRIETEEELAEFKDIQPDEWKVDKLAYILLGNPYERMFTYLLNQSQITE